MIVERLKPEDRFITNDKGETPLDIAKKDEIKDLFKPRVKKAIC